MKGRFTFDELMKAASREYQFVFAGTEPNRRRQEIIVRSSDVREARIHVRRYERQFGGKFKLASVSRW